MGSSPVRKRGRHIEAERNDHALLEAARDVIAAQGFDAPVAAIAQQAGVGIGSLYRRYSTKEQLLQTLCVLAMHQVIDAATAALDDADPWTGFERFVHRCIATRSGALGPLGGKIATTEEMWQTNRHAQQLATRVVRRAQDDGALRTDINHLDVSVMISRFSRSADANRTDDEEIIEQRMITLMLEGLRAQPDTTTLPGRPPTRGWYEASWQPASTTPDRS